MAKHAVLSPSSAERWIECPASVKLSQSIPKTTSSYAEEGSCAHELGEIKAAREFNLISETQYRRRRAAWAKAWKQYAGHDDTLAEMERHTDAYVELIRERLAIYPNSQLMLEQKLDTGVPSSWGTSDTVIVSPVHVEIIDFKYGAGVAVEAEGNPQLRLYALGALDTYGDILGDTEVVYTTVHQPRMDHILTAEITPDSLRTWRSEVAIPRGELALGPDAPFGPSESACRWCPVSGQCKAQAEAAFPDDLDADASPELLTPEEVAEYLGRLPLLKNWLKAFEAAALTKAYSEGILIPGWKVVRSGGVRQIKDSEQAIKFLVGLGHDTDEVSSRKLRGIGELEKLLGKEEFAEVMTDFITKTEGRESLVPESDKREPIMPSSEATKAFSDIEEEQ